MQVSYCYYYAFLRTAARTNLIVEGNETQTKFLINFFPLFSFMIVLLHHLERPKNTIILVTEILFAIMLMGSGIGIGNAKWS